MRIYVTERGRFIGDDLRAGQHYTAEPASSGTGAQNKAFHALVAEYWRSGCHSYNVYSAKDFKDAIKYYLGAGLDESTGEVKSWADYTKKERTETINALISEMHQAGVQTKKFYEILEGMERAGAESMAAEALGA